MKKPSLPGALVSVMLAALLVQSVNAKCAIFLEKVKTIQAGVSPKGIAITPDGRYAAVTDLEGGNILIFDVKRKKAVKKILLERTQGTGYDYQNNKAIPSFEEKPVECIFSPDGRYLLISLHNAGGIILYDMNETPHTFALTKKVVSVNLVSGTEKAYAVPFVKTGITPKVLTLSPDTRKLFVANWHSDNVSAIETGTMKKIYDAAGMRMPRGMCCFFNGRYLAVANTGSDSISVLNTQKRRTAYTVHTGKNPRHIVSGRYDGTVFVSLMGEGCVARVNLWKRRVEGKAKVGNSPRTIAVSPDGRHIFAANYYDDTVSVVDTASMQQTGCYKTGHRPCGLFVSPDGKELWVTNYLSGTLTVFRINNAFPWR
jgi:YVTN family beta-propeller protein